MALARIQYESDGSTDTYSLPFPYIAREDIEVSLDGTQTTAFSFLDGSTIKLDTVPAQGVIIDIVRRTEQNYLLVEFNDGSTLLESDLTLAAQQTFFMSQESLDQTGSTLTVANDGSYSASSRRISALGYPAGADDASTKQYVDDIFAQGEDAFEQAQLAEAWAQEAEGVEVAPGEFSAYHHATKAGYSETAAATSESNAATSETNAANSESAAATSETNAAASETAAATSETNADSHATESQNWANLAEDTLVPEGDQVDDYSALHWARKAEGWAAGVNMPSATDHGGELIRQAADETGFEYMTPATARAAIGLPIASTAQAESGTAGVFPDAANVHAAFNQYGLGLTGADAPNILADITESGFYRTVVTTSDRPSGSAHVGNTVIHQQHSTGDASQIFIWGNIDRVHFRVIADGVVGVWREIYHQSSILGTVSQSAGVPTGAIIERGSNANGEYVKFADGTMICWRSETLSGLSITSTGKTSVGTRQFPATFSETPVKLVSGWPSNSGGSSLFATVCIRDWVTSEWYIEVVSHTTSEITRVLALSTVAIGRWF